MAGETEEEVAVSVETLVLAEVIDNIAGGLHAIAGAINRLAEATAGEEFSEDEEDSEFYLDGTRK